MSNNNLDTVRVLDHGFVTLRNVAGPTRRPQAPFDANDVDPANAARMSFDQMDKGRTREMDLKLADYLMRNWHTSPFEMVEVWLEMKMPIFVARQFVRHRTASINEVSGRYVELPKEWYVPKPENVQMQVQNKKQGGRPVDLSEPAEVQQAELFTTRLDMQCAASYRQYQEAIASGIAHEQARLFLHLNHYTHWLWKQDLHNIMHLLSLRDHSHAQGEAAQYARAITSLLSKVLPYSIELYGRYRRRQ